MSITSGAKKHAPGFLIISVLKAIVILLPCVAKFYWMFLAKRTLLFSLIITMPQQLLKYEAKCYLHSYIKYKRVIDSRVDYK